MTTTKKMLTTILIFNLLILLTAIILFFTLNQATNIRDTILISGVAFFSLVSLVLVSLSLKDSKTVKIYTLIFAFLSLLLIVIPRGIGGYTNCTVGDTTDSIFIYYFILLIIYSIHAFVGNFFVIKSIYLKK